MFSMTKVLTSFVALRLYEDGLFKLDDAVGDYIPSFERDWEIVVDCESGGETIDYRSFLTGETTTLHYKRVGSKEPMRIKHLMSETSGIEYEIFSEYDTLFGGGVCNRNAGMVVNALRQQIHPDVYRSTAILGADLTLEQFVDTIAKAGVLTCEPGEFSYGHGATVLGRLIEIVYEKKQGIFKRFSDIMAELLFEPLGMSDATFFLADGDPRRERVPTLYGAVVGSDGESTHIMREEDCLPAGGPPIVNQTAHYSGPRKYDSGDTGAMMTAADYAKFYDMLLAGGISQSGERLLSPQGIKTLCKGRFKDLRLDVPLARSFGVAGDASPFPRSFNFGWATSHGETTAFTEYTTSDHVDMCNWGGYACTQGFFYPNEDAYMLVCPQIMNTTPGCFAHGSAVIRNASMAAFHSVWR
jgi:CubicO group peptidase (beta-lactamase class C family)